MVVASNMIMVYNTSYMVIVIKLVIREKPNNGFIIIKLNYRVRLLVGVLDDGLCFRKRNIAKSVARN